MIEIHPFEAFIPPHCPVLILGSFPGKESTLINREGDWYYGAPRNQFWRILSKVYQMDFPNLDSKQALFSQLGIGITDIIKSCTRSENKNLDSNLTDISYNTATIKSILENGDIEKILFTSKWVGKKFKKEIEPFVANRNYLKITLPSPSPIYQMLTIDQKTEIYKKELPSLY